MTKTKRFLRVLRRTFRRNGSAAILSTVRRHDSNSEHEHFLKETCLPHAPLDELIRDYISRPNYKGLRAKPLAKDLGIKKQRFQEFLDKVDELTAAGVIGRTESGKIIPGR